MKGKVIRVGAYDKTIRRVKNGRLSTNQSFIYISIPTFLEDSLENYTKRLEALEEIALSFEGVDKCYAIQAGREVRILVNAENVDDITSSRLARDVVKKIEDNLVYPGLIKVTVIRETRSVEYAR